MHKANICGSVLLQLMKTRLGKCYAMEAYGTIYIKTSTLMSLQRRAVKDENKTS
jgi:hypothetical protein